MKSQDVFSALSDPTRRRILALLKDGSKTAGELSEHFEMAKASVSHHFNVLKAADLVRCERQGQQQIYSLNTSVFEDVGVLLFEMFGVRTRDGGQE